MLKFRMKGRSKPERLNLVLNDETPFAVVEAYKAARTNFMFLLSDHNRKEVVFTSAVSEEGKTTTCINMAITFAQTGSKVLIIDADMRKPRVHRLLKVPSSPGLSDRLGNLTEQECIYATYQPNVFVMPAGTIPPNPAELLASATMQQLLEELNESFDHIFIDTPPVEVVTDAAVLASRLHGLILVARQDYSRKEIVQSAMDSLEQIGVGILGMLLTDVKVDRYGSRYRYSRYYGDYGYGQNDENDEEEYEN
ncbi:MAG: CpsD/CapB family tyrosine-protein kinase [Firmicutes bacterium]|nr:CpsD/CapB family tyrosine-protein kinase [Bacillota bacterium]